MIYLADKYGQFLPKDMAGRSKVIEWLMWQMGGLGPMLGQTHHFLHFNAGKAAYAEERYRKEAKRLYSVLNQQLSGQDFVVGDYSIADMAIWPWVSRYGWQDIDLKDYPNVHRWYKQLLSRDAVQCGYHIPKHGGAIPEG